MMKVLSTFVAILLLVSFTTSEDPKLQLVDGPTYLGNDIYVVVQTEEVFMFETDDEMMSFIQLKFPVQETSPSDYDCVQDDEDYKQFNCVITYDEGLPERNFPILFYYQNEGKNSAKLDVNIKLKPDQ